MMRTLMCTPYAWSKHSSSVCCRPGLCSIWAMSGSNMVYTRTLMCYRPMIYYCCVCEFIYVWSNSPCLLSILTRRICCLSYTTVSVRLQVRSSMLKTGQATNRFCKTDIPYYNADATLHKLDSHALYQSKKRSDACHARASPNHQRTSQMAQLLLNAKHITKRQACY